MIKRILSRLFRHAITRHGYAEKFAFVSMGTAVALRRIAARGITVGSVLDVGASNGSWSLGTRKCWPEARYHLVEANPQHQAALDALCSTMPGFSYVLAAASDEPGTLFFDDSSAFGGLAMKAENQGKPGIRSVPAVTLDAEVKRRALPGPYLVKLDTHGFEVPILNGAKEVLANANLVVIEAYNFQLEKNSLKFWEMCHFMDNLGFAVIDLSEPLWRPRDDCLWQMDLFFVPKSRPEFSYHHYA